jgi:pimeloyl-ACP methyl ester carboxylesterase
VLQAYDLGLANTLRQRAVARVVDDCRVDPACAAEHPHVTDAWARLAWDTVPVRVGGRSAVHAGASVPGPNLLAALGVLLNYDALLEMIPGLLGELASGSAKRVDLLDVVVPAALELGGDLWAMPQYWMGYLAVACGESPLGITQFGGLLLCEALGVPFVGLEKVAPIVSDTPVLILTGRYDGVTAPEWASVLQRNLPRAQAVELPVGHVTHVHAAAEDCVARVVLAFVRAPTASIDDGRACATSTGERQGFYGIGRGDLRIERAASNRYRCRASTGAAAATRLLGCMDG